MVSGLQDWWTRSLINVSALPAEGVEFINSDYLGTVSGGTGVLLTIRPPQGFIYELLCMNLRAEAPEGATAGVHFFLILSESLDVPVTYGCSNYADDVEFSYNYWYTATNRADPPSDTAQLLSIRKLRFDNQNGLVIGYYNWTDVDQTNKIIIRLWVRKLKVIEV